MITLPTFADVRAAAARIAAHVHRTPVLTSQAIDAELGCSVAFKCENLQKVGAFKARGAVNAVFALDDASAARGVITHSSGNHGAALAYAAARRGIPCVVVVPDDAPCVKADAVRGYGAEIVLCPRDARDATCARLRDERGLVMIHSFEHPDVIAGQGTAALELLEDLPDLDVVITPIGGGGLCSGTVLAVRGLRPSVAVLGAEPLAADDAARSLATGTLQPKVENPRTWCDGLMGGLGAPNFQILRDAGVSVISVSEDAILAAARTLLERMKIVVEPSSATVLAALRTARDRFGGLRVGAILSGGNTDFRWLSGGR